MSAPPVQSPFSAAITSAIAEVNPPDTPPVPMLAVPTAQPGSPWATVAANAAQSALSARATRHRPPPPHMTLWLEPCPPQAVPSTPAQALWFALFEQHRDVILANCRAMVDDDLSTVLDKLPLPAAAMSEVVLLRHLQAKQEMVSATDPTTGRLLLLPAQDLPVSVGVGYLRQWVQPQITPRFLRDTLLALDAGAIVPPEHEQAAKEFFNYVLMDLSNGEHFFDIALTSGVPVHTLMKFVRAYSEGSPALARQVQQALDDGLDVASAAFSRAAEDPRVSEDMLDRLKLALTARRDLVLRLQDSRYAPATVQSKASLRANVAGMQIDFTFDTASQAPSTTFLPHRPTTLAQLGGVGKPAVQGDVTDVG